jgi:phage/plasmid-like protein (TIGR03299 family)
MPANVQKMMYVGEKPWHGEGTKLENVATSAEAIEAAGLDWKVEKRELFFQFQGMSQQSGTAGIQRVPGKYATVRTDNQTPLGIVGKVYTPLQNKEAFSFFDSIVGVKEAMYHTAGSLGVGERVWILAKLPGYIKVTEDDVVEKYLLLANSHDGSSAVEMLFTPVRVVCQNTLNLAISTTEKKISLRHTISIGSKIDDVRKQLGIIHYQYQIFGETAQKMVSVQMTQSQYAEYLQKIGLVVLDEKGKMSTRSQNNYDTLVSLYEHGKGNDAKDVAGTVWAAMNAVVEYVDYVRGSDENRAKSILYGSGADIKQKAWDLAVARV